MLLLINTLVYFLSSKRTFQRYHKSEFCLRDVGYSQFKKFFDNKIKSKNITHIYLFFTNKEELNYGLERYIFEYYNSDCLKIDNLENYLIKINLTNCVI